MKQRQLDAIFSPRSVAVVGASRRRDSIGFSLLHNLVMNEFNGAIFPVNPEAAVIHSLKAYPSVLDVPDPVDLAVIAVPSLGVPAVVEECIEKGVRGLVVITAGFAESGDEGARAEAAILERVRAAGVRMIGPNCMGVINTDSEVRLDATFAPTRARRGSVGFVSQSGALGVAILNAADDLGIGLTQFVSMGNKADVSGNDLLEYWEDDPATRVICMYLEAFGNPRHFTPIAKRVGRKKPILVVKSGRTAEGARAATSHTGAIAAGADVTVSAFLEQCGVIRADSMDELFDLARAFDSCPLPPGSRVAVVTNAGGPGIMATDACVNLGLEMAAFSEATRRRLRRRLPPEASVLNPVDMIASADPASYADTLEIVAADPEVDMLLVINVTPLLGDPSDVLAAVAGQVGKLDQPVVTVMMATEAFYEKVREASDLPPVYRFPESAARALASLARYAEWRRRPAAAAAPSFEVDDGGVAAILARTREGYLSQEEAFEVLRRYGIPVAPCRVVEGPAAARAAAEEIGLPVVVKAMVPGLVHKSDVGGVAMDLRTLVEVEEAVEAMGERLEEAVHRPDGYMVQQMARGGHEVIFGLSTDPRFGPLLMFGLGGRYVEVFRDVRFGVVPLAPVEAREMIRGIRGFALLEGVRGEAPADLTILEEILLRLAQLAQRHPRIQELDVNPFLAAADRADAKAVDVRIRVGEVEPEG